MNGFFLRLRALFLRQRADRDLDDELAFHIEMETRKHLASGMSQQEAARAARLHFGASASAVKDYVRDTRRIGFLETLFHDMRYALRGFRRAPLFALTIIGTIAIGLGWNAAAFTIFNAYFLQPIDVRDPYSLFTAGWMDRTGRLHAYTWDQYQDLRASARSFSDVYAFTNAETRMEGHNAFAELVTGDYFRILGVGSTVGRTLLPADEQTNRPVLVLSYTAWKNQFGGVPDIVGRSVGIHGNRFEVVGVAREGFSGLEAVPMDYWVPITAAQVREGQVREGIDPFGPGGVGVAVRLRSGVSQRQAQAELTAFSQRQTASLPPEKRATAAQLTSQATRLGNGYLDVLVDLSPILFALFLVLLSACANVANMMLARALSRQREIGIRLSIGAPRSRLIRQLLTESILLALPAAAVGFLVSQVVIAGGLRLLSATLPGEFLEYIHILPLSPDLRVFGFMIAAAFVAALLFGLVPALQATRLNVMQAARGDFSSDYRPGRLRSALVVAQVTVCACLLTCTAVLLHSAIRASKVDPGIRTSDVINVQIRDKSVPRAVATLSAEPSVKLLAAAAVAPMQVTLPFVSSAGSPAAGSLSAQYNFVSPSYFDLLEIRILRGRNFLPSELAGETQIAILSETAAARLWPNRDPIGQTVDLTKAQYAFHGRLQRPATVRVIGVVSDTVLGWKDDARERTTLYLPTALDTSGTVLVARVQGDAEPARRSLESVLESADPGSVLGIHKLQDFAAMHVYPYRLGSWISLALGFIALLLALSGVYGALAYIVAQRTKEIGIRMAMGGSAGAVLRMILRQSALLAGMGIVFGTVLAFGASKLMAANLMIDPYDRAAYIGGIATVLTACLAAAFIPARRAARIDPITTLRYD